ncbi:MAG: hypothetical protein ACREL6_09040 [Gemmatimonadales bacterium]
MRIPLNFLLVSALVIGVAACGDDAPPPPPSLSEVLPTLPLPPNATSVVSREGGVDALQLTFGSTLSRDEVAAYYRTSLPDGGWDLVSDQETGQGEISIYAERDRLPIWIGIRSDSTTGGSLVRISGAATGRTRDSAAVGQ